MFTKQIVCCNKTCYTLRRLSVHTLNFVSYSVGISEVNPVDRREQSSSHPIPYFANVNAKSATTVRGKSLNNKLAEEIHPHHNVVRVKATVIQLCV